MAMGFYEKYFNYIGTSESPKIYHRWCAISAVAAMLGRRVYLPFGHDLIYPNMYILLTGTPGARKGSAMKPAKKALQAIGFTKVASQRISPERFLAEIKEVNTPATEEIEDLELETLTTDTPSELYVMSDEYGDFIKGNIDFIRLLTNLWDNLPFYRHPKFHGKSIYINEPTLNILGATTPQDMAMVMPIEAIGQGALSRYILVHSEPTGVKITFPSPPEETAYNAVVEELQEIQDLVFGPILMGQDTRELLDRIYKSTPILDDPRFMYYNTRRFTHLIKLSIVFAAMDKSTSVLPLHVLEANTLLVATEARMPKALGEFGKGRHADVANMIMERLRSSIKPLTIKEIWRYVAQDMNKLEDLIDLMKNLKEAEKVQMIKGIGSQGGWIPLHLDVNTWNKDFLIQGEFLRPEERI